MSTVSEKLSTNIGRYNPYVWEQRMPVEGICLAQQGIEIIRWCSKAPKNLQLLKKAGQDMDDSDLGLPKGPEWANGSAWLVGGRMRKKRAAVGFATAFADRSLHRRFAGLSETDQIREFAVKHGFLGGPMALVRHEARLQPAELVAEWRWQVFRMQTLIRIFDLLERNGDSSAVALSRFFSCQPFYDFECDDVREGRRAPKQVDCSFDSELAIREGFEVEDPADRRVPYKAPQVDLDQFTSDEKERMKGEFGLESDAELLASLLEVLPPDNMAEIASVMLIGEINRELERGTAVRLNPEHYEQVQIVVRDLRAAIYCSLMFEVSRQTSLLRRCANCGTWFEAMNARQRFCEPVCGKAASRRKKSDQGQEER